MSFHLFKTYFMVTRKISNVCFYYKATYAWIGRTIQFYIKFGFLSYCKLLELFKYQLIDLYSRAVYKNDMVFKN